MKKADKERMHNNIQKHGENLNAIFDTNLEPVTLCKKLFRLENKAHRLATDWCNGAITSDQFDIESQTILHKVGKILGNRLGIFVNGDARGYALKIDDRLAESMTIYKDWGGYGIIAPDFTPRVRISTPA